MPATDASFPLVSVVTPSLDQGRFIEEAIKSVIGQDYPNIEHIVVDGGSTDGTVEVLRRYPHLEWISEPDHGQSAALNKGFRRARGEILGWINADDYYLPGAVRAAVDLLRDTECALVHGGWRRITEEGDLLGDVKPIPFEFRRLLEVSNTVAQPGSFFTREAFEAVGGIDEDLHYAMDYALWVKLGERYKVGHVDRVQAAYRYHPHSKSVAEYRKFAEETWRVSRRHGARLRSPIFLDFYLRFERPRLHRALVAARLLRAGDLRPLVAGVGRRLRPSE